LNYDHWLLGAAEFGIGCLLTERAYYLVFSGLEAASVSVSDVFPGAAPSAGTAFEAGFVGLSAFGSVDICAGFGAVEIMGCAGLCSGVFAFV